MISTAELAALAEHYAATVQDHTGTACEVMRGLSGQYVAVYAPIGRTVPLGDTRDGAYATLAALLATVEHTTTPGDATS